MSGLAWTFPDFSLVATNRFELLIYRLSGDCSAWLSYVAKTGADEGTQTLAVAAYKAAALSLSYAGKKSTELPQDLEAAEGVEPI